MIRRRVAGQVVATLVLLASFTLGGCGGSQKPAICSDVDALKTSVADVTNVDLRSDSLATIQSRLAQVKSDLVTLKNDAQAQYSTEVDAVDRAASSLGDSLDTAISSPSAQSVAAVGTALQSLGTALSGLEDAVSNTC